ncbi:MAG: ParB family transcriptional regulator, chromosome partitioning protein [Acidobacteriota bacterium]|nr:ParB family transcriptional regulator, chromosome partitioning protein [Acidobacteriota bacterium]
MSEPSRKRGGLPMRVKMRHDTHFVEELTARHETPVGKMVPLSTLEPDPNQPRSTMGDLDELVASIREKGILEPILVRPRPESEEEAPPGVLYRIISGERRYRASQEAGLYEVPVIEMDVSEQEALEIALIENLQRKDLTPFEEAEGYRLLAERHEYTHEEIATSVGKSRTVITESLSLLQMPPRVRDTVQALALTSKSLLLEVLKAGEETEMIGLLEEVARRGLNRDDLRQRLRRDKGNKGGRRRPYVFKFKSPDRSYNLSMTFRQSEVDKEDLIRALEQILLDLRKETA